MLATVAVLVAVLVGVAPRVVLPTGWVLGRSVDEHTLTSPRSSAGPVPARPARPDAAGPERSRLLSPMRP